MSSRTGVLALAMAVALPAPVLAQEKLAYLIPTLYGPTGLTVNSEAVLPNGSTHSAHFNSSFQANFSPFNSALAQRLASVTRPAPASGFT